MKLPITFITTFLCLVGLVTAIKNTTREFRLKTCLLKPFYERYKFDNLYVFSYFAGAGMSDATLSPHPWINRNGVAFFHPSSPKSKEGYIIFQLSDNVGWGLKTPIDRPYNQWSSVTIDVGDGRSHYKINGTGILVSTDPMWGGWMVCDWAHGMPQLFWRMYNADNLPRSCGIVQLVVEYL